MPVDVHAWQIAGPDMVPGATLARKLYDEMAGQGLGRLGTQALFQRYLAAAGA